MRQGDVITISWEVLNAEQVRINLIGEVSTNGTQTIRLTVPSPNEPFLYLDLEASNGHNLQSSRKRLALKNSAFKLGGATGLPSAEALDWAAAVPATLVEEPTPPTPSSDKVRKKATKKTKPRTPKKAISPVSGKQQNAWMAYLLIVVLFFMIAVMLYTILLINPIF